MDFYVAVSTVSQIPYCILICSSDASLLTWHLTTKTIDYERKRQQKPFESRATHGNNRSLRNKGAIEA